MKKIYTLLILSGLVGSYFLISGFGLGPATVQGASYTGAPGELGLICSNCHGSPGSYGGITTLVEVFDQGTTTPVTNYASATTYDVQVTVNHGANVPVGFGFQCVAVDGVGAQVGSFQNPQSNTKIVPLSTGVQVAEHNGISVFGQAHVFKWEWITPVFFNSVDVTFYSTGAAVNSNSANSGDSGSSTSGTLTLTSSSFPVEFIDFTVANLDNKYHLLEWSTASEQEADYFVVEHSMNGESFKSIAQVKAAGTTIERQNYQFRFADPQHGTNYYRLRQVDEDGASHIYKTISAYQFKDLELVKAYPVPTYDDITLEVRYIETSDFTLEIIDPSGKTVKQQQVLFEAGVNTIELDLSDLASGAYHIKLFNGQSLITTPVLKF